MKDMTKAQATLVAVQLLTPYLGKPTFYQPPPNDAKLKPESELNPIPLQPLYDTLVKNDKDNGTHFFEDFIRQLIFLCHNLGYTIGLNTAFFLNGKLGTFGKLVRYILTHTIPSSDL